MPDSHPLAAMVSRFREARILIIGDVIVDNFIRGSVSRISPEAPVPVVNVSHEELLLGGAANVLKNIFTLGGSGALCGITGNDAMGERLRELLEDLPAGVDGLIRGQRPTTVKTRVLAQGQQLIRFDSEQIGMPSRASVQGLCAFLDKRLADFDVVIISDYAKGVICEPLMRHLGSLRRELEQRRGRALPMIVDPKPANLHHFVDATVITPNNLEAEQITGMTIQGENTLRAAAHAIRDEIGCEAVLITRGEAGMALLQDKEDLVRIPTMAREVFDVTGAGDTVVATMALGLAAGCSLEEAAVLANYAAGVVVGKVGTAGVSSDELLTALAVGEQ